MSKYKELMSKVWDVFYLVRSYTDNYIVVLFLLSIKKEGLQSNRSDGRGFDIFNDYRVEILDNDDNRYSVYKELFREFENIIFSFEPTDFKRILDALDDINRGFLVINFHAIFDDVLKKIMEISGRYPSVDILPFEISKFTVDLADVKPNDNVYDPFAGFGLFGVHFNSKANYISQEYNKEAWVIGMLRLLAYGYGQTFYNQNPLNFWLGDNQKFDKIISFPPIAGKIEFYDDKFGEINTYDQFLFLKGIDSLKQGGKLIAIVSNGFLTNQGSAKKIRERLISNDHVEMVISLPNGLLKQTSVGISIIVINTDKIEKNKVKFIDASGFVEIKSRKEKILLGDQLLDFIKANNDNRDVILVDNNDIASKDFALIPKIFFPVEILKGEKDEIVTLGTVLTHFSSKPINEEKIGTFIRIKDLMTDKVNYKITKFESIEVGSLSRKVEKSCLLISTRGQNLKPTYFEYTGTPIYVNFDILTFSVNEIKINIDYLIHELHSDYMEEYVEKYSKGATIGTIRLDDILKFNIKLPSLSEQNNLMRIVKEAIAFEKKKELELFNKIHGLESEMDNQNNFLRHSIAGNISNLRGSIRRIDNILRNQVLLKDPNLLQYKEHENSNLNLEKLLDMIQRDIEKITIDTQRNALGDKSLNNIILEPINVIKFLNDYVLEVRNREDCNFMITLSLTESEFWDTEGKPLDVFINGNKDKLKDLFDNLIENAVVHAFLPELRDENIIDIQPMFDLSSPENIVISVMNNGKTLPEGFTTEMFIRKGSKAGSNANNGFGGWYINQIIQKHNGEMVDIINEQESAYGIKGEWATSIEFSLPILSIEKDETI